MNDAAMLYRLAAESWTRIRRRRVEQRETMRDALRRLARSKTEQARRAAQGEIARLLGTLRMRVAIGESCAADRTPHGHRRCGQRVGGNAPT